MVALVVLFVAPAAAGAASLPDLDFDLRTVAQPSAPASEIVVTAQRSPWRLRDDAEARGLDPPARLRLRVGNALIQPEVVTGRMGEGQVHMVLHLPF